MATSPMRVLVVEDELKVANALREGLEGEHYEVVVERTGESAFFRINTEPFDLILLDLMMPEVSGEDGAAALDVAHLVLAAIADHAARQSA